MNILVLGSGGREHALAWRLAQDKTCTRLYIWPGNAGMSYLPFEHKDKFFPVNDIFSKAKLKEVIATGNIELVIPGAEKFLYEGVADWCREWKLPCFGPTMASAMLERSKLFSKKIMSEAGIPTARYADLTAAFHSDLTIANTILKQFKKPVIKISGPSLGKGVFVCADVAEAITTLKQIKENPLPGMEEGIFVEEAVTGEEISLFYACHGSEYLFLGAAQDHKRLNDHDLGPNTGGMGAITPVSWASPQFIDQVTQNFVVPTLKRMQEIQAPFTGVLFLGLMVDGTRMNLLEYNVRFGDPETQVIVPMIDGDLSATLLQISRGEKSSQPLSLKSGVAVHIVKAAKGYPGTFGTAIEKGQKINATASANPACHFFFAGVKAQGLDLVTDGGRVLGVTAWDNSKEAAQALAYQQLQNLSFSGEHYRRDIGNKQ